MIEWKKKRDIMHHYNKLASVYDTQYAVEQIRKIEAALEGVVLSKSDLVLDVGCGTGFIFPHIAHETKLLIGIDISRELLRKAQRRKKQHPNTYILLADSDHLPFQNQIFNTILAITLIQNTPNPSSTLQEIKRVSKSCAIIVVTGLKKKFTKKTFISALEDARLEVSTLKADANLKDYIATCLVQKS